MTRKRVVQMAVHQRHCRHWRKIAMLKSGTDHIERDLASVTCYLIIKTKPDTYAKMYTLLSLTDQLWLSPLWSYNVNRGVAQKQIYALGRGQFPFMNLGV